MSADDNRGSVSPQCHALLRACYNAGRMYSDSMTQAVAQILEEAEQLSARERAELAERLVESLAHDIPQDISQAQITEVRRRIAQVEAGEVALIPGVKALAQVRQLVASARATS
jgi:putative addiction module component (TIGR02574 family)